MRSTRHYVLNRRYYQRHYQIRPIHLMDLWPDPLKQSRPALLMSQPHFCYYYPKRNHTKGCTFCSKAAFLVPQMPRNVGTGTRRSEESHRFSFQSELVRSANIYWMLKINKNITDDPKTGKTLPIRTSRGMSELKFSLPLTMWDTRLLLTHGRHDTYLKAGKCNQLLQTKKAGRK